MNRGKLSLVAIANMRWHTTAIYFALQLFGDKRTTENKVATAGVVYLLPVILQRVVVSRDEENSLEISNIEYWCPCFCFLLFCFLLFFSLLWLNFALCLLFDFLSYQLSILRIKATRELLYCLSLFLHYYACLVSVKTNHHHTCTTEILYPTAFSVISPAFNIKLSYSLISSSIQFVDCEDVPAPSTALLYTCVTPDVGLTCLLTRNLVD